QPPQLPRQLGHHAGRAAGELARPGRGRAAVRAGPPGRRRPQQPERRGHQERGGERHAARRRARRADAVGLRRPGRRGLPLRGAAGRPGGRGRRGRPGRGRRPHRPGVPGLRLAQPRRRPEGPAVRGRGRRRPVLQRRAVAPGPARRARELRALRRGRPALRHRVPARRGGARALAACCHGAARGRRPSPPSSRRGPLPCSPRDSRSSSSTAVGRTGPCAYPRVTFAAPQRSRAYRSPGPERVEIHVLPGLDPVLILVCTLAILLLPGEGSQ
ncbi:unnamed protein product, partial [Prorocentrum cordatum]